MDDEWCFHPEEALRMGKAMLTTLYGSDNYKRWGCLKRRLGFKYEADFISWILDYLDKNGAVGEVCERTEEEQEIEEFDANDIKTEYESVNGDGELRKQDLAAKKSEDNSFDGYSGEEVYDLLSTVNISFPTDPESRDANCEQQPKDPENCTANNDVSTNPGSRDVKVKSKTSKNFEQEAIISGTPKSNKLVVCKYCNQKFANKGHWKEHVQIMHENAQIYTCDLCKFKTKRERFLKLHCISKHGQASDFRCNICSKYMISRKALRRHTCVSATGGNADDNSAADASEDKKAREINCPYCGKNFDGIVARRLHVQKVHTNYLCDLCQFTTYTESRMTMHYIAKHGRQSNFACKTCGKYFTSEQRLHKHLSPPTIVCEYCGRKFTRVDSLKMHVEAAHKESKHCVHCPFKTAHVRNLKRHYISKHGHTTEFVCQACGQFMINEKALVYHRSKCVVKT